jgi:hypothetical protein
MRPFIYLTGLALAVLGMTALVEAQYPNAPPNSYTPPTNNLTWVYRLFNGQNGDHLYTSDVNEVNTVPAYGFTYEGPAFAISRVAGAGTVPLYRFHLPNGTHALSTSPQAPSVGYVPPEGVVGYIWSSAQPGLSALYQWYNPNLGVFFYTTDPRGEAAPGSGFIYQGILGYVAPSAS